MKNKTLTPFAKILLSIILLIILICLIKLIFGIAYITDDYKYINSTEKILITDNGFTYLNPFKNYKRIYYPGTHAIFPIIIQTKDGKIYTSNIFVITKYDMNVVYKNNKFDIIKIDQNYFNSELLTFSSNYTLNELITINRETFITKIKSLIEMYINDNAISIMYINITDPFIEVQVIK